MRHRALRMAVVALALALGGCAADRPPVDPGPVSFLLDGVHYDYPNSSVTDDGYGHLSLDAGDAGLSIHLGASAYVGTFATVPEDSVGPPSSAGGTVYRDGEQYSTRLGGAGQVVIEHYGCQTTTVEDPITGVTGTQTICNVAAKFEFTAHSETGASVSVTHGYWSARFRRLPRSCGGPLPPC